MNKGPYSDLHLYDFAYASHSKSAIQEETTYLLPTPPSPYQEESITFTHTVRNSLNDTGFFSIDQLPSIFVSCFSCILTPHEAGKALLCFNVILIEWSATMGVELSWS